MHIQFEHLISLLDAETEHYQNLLACTRDEKRAIVNLDFDQLTEIGRQKEAVTLKLRRLSEHRSAAVKELSAGLAMPPDDLTLGRLSEEAPFPYRQELLRCRSVLRNLLELLIDENASVKQLVRHGLALVRGSYRLIAQMLDDSPVYQCSGNLQPATAAGKFHQRDY